MKKTLVIFFLLIGFLTGCAPSSDDLWARSAIRSKLQDGAMIVDVRTPAEYQRGHIEGAVNIPHTEIKARLNEFGNDNSRSIVVYCGKGGRAATAKKILEDEGYRNVWNLGSYENLVAEKNVPVG